MSGIAINKTITNPPDYTDGTTGSNLKSQFNANQATLHSGIQSVEDALEDGLYELFGSGVLDGMEATVGTGLSVNVAPGYALIGIVVDYAGGTVSVPANQAAGVIYFAQNGNFYTSAPTGVAYFQFCTYVSGASSVSSVGSTTKVMPCTLQSVTDTFENIEVSETHTCDYEIDHSASVEFLIPGFVTLSVSPAAAFTVERIDQESDTGTTFTVRISRNEGYRTYSQYYYIDGDNHGAYALCDLTFTRTGMAYN